MPIHSYYLELLQEVDADAVSGSTISSADYLTDQLKRINRSLNLNSMIQVSSRLFFQSKNCQVHKRLVFHYRPRNYNNNADDD